MKSNSHFKILINNKKINILALSEKTHIDKQLDTVEARLHIKTKIRGQEFPINATIKAIVNGVDTKYHCTLIGTFSSPKIIVYIYQIKSRQSVE